MKPQEAIDILEHASTLCRDIGAKNMAKNLHEVIMVIENLQDEIQSRDFRDAEESL